MHRKGGNEYTSVYLESMNSQGLQHRAKTQTVFIVSAFHAEREPSGTQDSLTQGGLTGLLHSTKFM